MCAEEADQHSVGVPTSIAVDSRSVDEDAASCQHTEPGVRNLLSPSTFTGSSNSVLHDDNDDDSSEGSFADETDEPAVTRPITVLPIALSTKMTKHRSSRDVTRRLPRREDPSKVLVKGASSMSFFCNESTGQPSVHMDTRFTRPTEPPLATKSDHRPAPPRRKMSKDLSSLSLDQAPAPPRRQNSSDTLSRVSWHNVQDAANDYKPQAPVRNASKDKLIDFRSLHAASLHGPPRPLRRGRRNNTTLHSSMIGFEEKQEISPQHNLSQCHSSFSDDSDVYEMMNTMIDDVGAQKRYSAPCMPSRKTSREVDKETNALSVSNHSRDPNVRSPSRRALLRRTSSRSLRAAA